MPPTSGLPCLSPASPRPQPPATATSTAAMARSNPFKRQQFSMFKHVSIFRNRLPILYLQLASVRKHPKPKCRPARFIDVIGRITAVSEVILIASMHQAEPSNTRTILLVNLQGKELKLVLWGNRALEFEEEAVRARNEKAAVIAIFVGTLPKMNQG